MCIRDRYYKKKGRLFDAPQPGDQIFFWPKDAIGGPAVQHTGLVYAVDDSYVCLLYTSRREHMDAATLGAALAIAKSIPNTAVGDATAAANRAEAAAQSVENSAAQIALFQALGLTLQDGKICVNVEKE